MDNQQTWVEALNISPENLADWSSQVPSGKPLLVWCLENGHVSAADYLGWACDHFGLPVLSAAFFEQMDRAYFNTHKGGDWSAWCFPLQEWDGVMYVACVEPPPAAERAANTCYVLADPRPMSEVWESTGVGMAAPMPPLPDTPEGISASHMPKVPTETASGEAPPAVPEELPPLPDAPAGINLNAPKKAFTLSLDESNLLLGDHHEETAATPPAPVSENTGLTRINAEPTVVGPSIELDEVTEMGIVDLSPPTKVAQMPEAPAAAKNPAIPSMPPPPKAKVSVPAPDDEPLAGESTQVADFSPPTAIHRVAPTGDNLHLPGNEAGALTAVFTNLGRQYTHSCVIRFGQDQQARLYKWSPSMKPADNGAKAVLNLTQPSFLRIVAKTLMPYHGYLVDSPTHQEFFQALGLAALPGCVTAAPVRLNGQLWGVILAMGPESLQAMENLGAVVSATDQLVGAIGGIWSKAA